MHIHEGVSLLCPQESQQISLYHSWQISPQYVSCLCYVLVVKHRLLRILDLVNVPCEILVETLTLTSVTVCIDL